MFEYLIAYRHQNNEVEGFKGVGFSKESAKRDAMRQIIVKVENLNPPQIFDAMRLIDNKKDLSADELVTVRKDWAI